MKETLEGTFEDFYSRETDPWSYWSSRYELEKYRQQIVLASSIVAPGSILEIGCSTGCHTRLIMEAFPSANVTGLDISAVALERAAVNLTGFPQVQLLKEDVFAAAKTFTPGSFDLIFWSEGFDYLHTHCTIAEFSELARQLALSLSPRGVLCVSHIVPDPLSYPALEAGAKNVEVFHSLLRDYFTSRLHFSDQAAKEETEQEYRYAIDLFRPRLLGVVRSEPRPQKVGKVDVVIPARDESDTIAAVVRSLRGSPSVDRILVVDNGSADGTAQAALASGATIVDCESRGYGRAVKRGIAEAGSDWILKLDGDIENFNPAWVESLVAGAETQRSKLVKACWVPTLEDPDRVTNFTVRPAFEIFFPELRWMRSPLSGIYLFERAAFDWQALPNDFAFDVALLIVQLEQQRRTCEIEIPPVRHASIANGKRTYDHYHRMSSEILRYLVRAGRARVQ